MSAGLTDPPCEDREGDGDPTSDFFVSNLLDRLRLASVTGPKLLARVHRDEFASVGFHRANELERRGIRVLGQVELTLCLAIPSVLDGVEESV